MELSSPHGNDVTAFLWDPLAQYQLSIITPWGLGDPWIYFSLTHKAWEFPKVSEEGLSLAHTLDKGQGAILDTGCSI